MKAVVVAGGSASEGDRRHLAGAELVIAADGGACWLTDAGMLPDVLVGDLDSCDPHEVAGLERRGVRIERHRSQKEASDTELALRTAIESGADEVTIIGALGGDRLDHQFANILLLLDAEWSAVRLSLVADGTSVRVVGAGERLVFDGSPGDLVTLLPLAGDADGVVTRGLRYRLDGEPLRIGRSRGLSNVIEAAGAWVSIRTGSLLVIESAVTQQGGRP